MADRSPSEFPAALWLDWWLPPPADGTGRVLATGVFDLVHVGHVRFLAAARAAGATLVVGVEDDERTRAWKGPSRPVVGEDERAEVVAALRSVDGVFVVHGPPSLRDGHAYAALLRPLAPARLAWTAGDPYRSVKQHVSTLLGTDGIEVPEVPGRSTTRLIGRSRA